SLLTFFLMVPRPPRPTLLPYTTLFRSGRARRRWPPPLSLAGSEGARRHLVRQPDRSRMGAASRLPSRPRRASRRQARLSAVSRRSEEHTSELQSRGHLVCRLLLEKKNR